MFLDEDQEIIIFFNGYWDLPMNIFISYLAIQLLSADYHLKEMRFFSYTAAKIHESQAYRNMDMTKERTSFMKDSRNIVLAYRIRISAYFP